jgi:hypothetical protein
MMSAQRPVATTSPTPIGCEDHMGLRFVTRAVPAAKSKLRQ